MSEFFDKLITVSRPAQNQVTFRSIFGEENHEDKRYNNLNRLINICYMYEVNLLDKKFDHLRGINDYYDWLLDINNFDYNKFNPKWVAQFDPK